MFKKRPFATHSRASKGLKSLPGYFLLKLGFDTSLSPPMISETDIIDV